MSNHLPAPTHSSSHRDIAWTFVVKKRLSWFSEMLQLEGTSAEVFQKVIGVPFEFRNAMMVRFYEFLDCRELSTFDTMVTMLLNADDNALVKIAKLCYDRCATFRKFCSALKGENWHARSTTALQSALANFYEEALLMIPVVYFEPNLGQRIRDLLLDQLQKHGSPHSLDECFLLLTSTSKELLIVREHRELLAIAGSIRSNPLVLNRFLSKTSEVAYGELPQEYRRAVDAHVENYSWINTDDIFGRPWNQFDLVDRLRFLVGKDCVAKLNDIDRRRNSKNDSFLALLAELNISGELLTLITSAREFSHLRTHRTEIYVQGMFYLQPLLSEIANRLHLEVDAMKFLSYSEIHSSLRSGTSIPADLLRERRSGMAYDMRDRKITAFFGNAA